MLSLTQNLLVAVLVMALFKRLWTAHERYARQDLIGWQLNILATTHAIIAGFMFDTEWPNFSVVKLNVEWEGSPLRAVFALAEGLPAPARMQLQALSLLNELISTAKIPGDIPNTQSLQIVPPGARACARS
jgi:hypothetical protein